MVMFIRMKKAAAGPTINWPIGSVQTVDDETGQALLADGAAEHIEAPTIGETPADDGAAATSNPADDGAAATSNPADDGAVVAKPKGKKA